MARILLVEDDDSIRQLLHDILIAAGHTVVTATNGQEGVDKFTPGAFDLLITDLVMPEKEGIEVLREIRAQQPALKTLAISGGGKFGGAETYLRLASLLGAKQILAKPFTREQFLAAVNEQLDPQSPKPES
jgi:CheY-like chemotaxis protein